MEEGPVGFSAQQSIRGGDTDNILSGLARGQGVGDEEEKGKSDFSLLSFDAATMVFGLTAMQQSNHWDASIQTIFLCGLTHGKGVGGEEKIKLLLLVLRRGRKQRRPGRSRIGAVIRDMDGVTQQSTHGGTVMHMNTLDA